MIRKTIFAVATVAAIGATALIPTEASAGGGGKGGGLHKHWGHGHWGRGFGILVIGPSCWRWVRLLLIDRCRRDLAERAHLVGAFFFRVSQYPQLGGGV
jgi:hypothetical protein